MSKVTERDILNMIKVYSECGNVHVVGRSLGFSHATVHNHLSRLGLIVTNRWTDEKLAKLIDFYNEGFCLGDGKLDEFCDHIGFPKTSVCSKANSLGLTVQGRFLDNSVKETIGRKASRRWKENEHPRGFLGGKHTDEAKQTMSEKSIDNWKGATQEQIDARTEKMCATRKKNGTTGPKHGHTRTKSGKREDMDNMFFRSAAEANYARYLKHVAKLDFVYEGEVFYFDKIKRGVISYKPDFYIPELDQYHEFKGWLDPKSITRLRRFRIYHPDKFAKLILVKQSLTKKDWTNINKIGFEPKNVVDFKTIEKFSGIVPGWE